MQIPIWNIVKLLHYGPFLSTSPHAIFRYQSEAATGLKRVKLNSYFGKGLAFATFFRSYDL